MNSPRHNKFSRGQTALEYLLLLAVVVVIVIVSFSPGSLISTVRSTAENFYNGITEVIQGTKTPTAVNGGWCAVACTQGLSGQNLYAKCACPAPAFGGDYCHDVGVRVSCNPGDTSGTPGCAPAPKLAAIIGCGKAPAPPGPIKPPDCVPAPDCTNSCVDTKTCVKFSPKKCIQSNKKKQCIKWAPQKCVQQGDVFTCAGNNCCGFDSCGHACGCNGGSCPAGDICNDKSPGMPGTCQPQKSDCQGNCSKCVYDPNLKGSFCDYLIQQDAMNAGAPCRWNGQPLTCADSLTPGKATCVIPHQGCGTACTDTPSGTCQGNPTSCIIKYTNVVVSPNGGAACLDVNLNPVTVEGQTANCQDGTSCTIGGQADGWCIGGQCVCQGSDTSCHIFNGICVACGPNAHCKQGSCQCDGTNQSCILGNDSCTPCPNGQTCEGNCCSSSCSPSQTACGTVVKDNCGVSCPAGTQCNDPKNQVCEANVKGGLLQCCNSCASQGDAGDLGSSCGTQVTDACGQICGCSKGLICSDPTKGKCCTPGCDPLTCGSVWDCKQICSATPEVYSCTAKVSTCGLGPAVDDGSCCPKGQSKGCDGVCSVTPCTTCDCNKTCNGPAVPTGCDGVSCNNLLGGTLLCSGIKVPGSPCGYSGTCCSGPGSTASYFNGKQISTSNCPSVNGVQENCVNGVCQ